MFTYETANVKVTNGQILVVVGCGGQGLEKVSIFTAKKHICACIHVVCDIPRENWLGV